MLNKYFQKLKRKIRYKLDEHEFHSETEIDKTSIKQLHDDLNILFITFDSCRYDSFVQAKTPNLDRYAPVYEADTPGTYTLPAHASFFTGIFPLVNEPIPYLNRFTKQLITMKKAGQALSHAKGRFTIELEADSHDMIYGLNRQGYYTVGTGSATWFAKEVLTKHFQDFQYSHALSAIKQCNFINRKLRANSQKKPFFAFMNFSETHTPYMHYGSDREEFAMQARDYMKFPPLIEPNLQASFGAKLKQAQITAVEHLDALMGEFLPLLPPKTFVIITADHGEAFGEDGYWGHGVYHPSVMKVPMMGFVLDGSPLLD